MSKSLIRNLKHQYQVYLRENKCCVCGSLNCQESVDHSKVTLKQINQLFQDKLLKQTQILQIKQKITQIYQNIKINLLNALEKDEYEMQNYINKFNFSENLTAQINATLISELMEQNVRQLPTRKIIKLVKKLEKNHEIEQTDRLEELKGKSETLFLNFNVQALLQTIKPKLPLKFFIKEPKELKLKPKTSISQITNPEESDLTDENKVYEWRNIRVTKNSRTVSLSNKNISDREVMEQIPILANYKNLKEFEIRNNKISCLSCNLIANNMPFLLSVDIRGNNISDKGIIKLIHNIPKLKSLFISETLATDLTGEEVANRLNDLEMFWSEYTKISNEVALKIAQKPKLKVLSLVGNPIDDEFKEKMKKLFIPKGYIAL